MGWGQPIFFWSLDTGWQVEGAVSLGELLEQTVPAMGYELVDWDMSARSRLVRVFIDKPNGVDVEDCARVSNHLTHLFAVEEIDFERLRCRRPDSIAR